MDRWRWHMKTASDVATFERLAGLRLDAEHRAGVP
jgi:hypothetical protein